MGFWDSFNGAQEKSSRGFADSNTKLTWEQENIQSQRGFNSTNDNELINMYRNSNSRFSSEELEVIRITLFQRGYRLQSGDFVK